MFDILEQLFEWLMNEYHPFYCWFLVGYAIPILGPFLRVFDFFNLAIGILQGIKYLRDRRAVRAGSVSAEEQLSADLALQAHVLADAEKTCADMFELSSRFETETVADDTVATANNNNNNTTRAARLAEIDKMRKKSLELWDTTERLSTEAKTPEQLLQANKAFNEAVAHMNALDELVARHRIAEEERESRGYQQQQQQQTIEELVDSMSTGDWQVLEKALGEG